MKVTPILGMPFQKCFAAREFVTVEQFDDFKIEYKAGFEFDEKAPIAKSNNYIMTSSLTNMNPGDLTLAVKDHLLLANVGRETNAAWFGRCGLPSGARVQGLLVSTWMTSRVAVRRKV